MSHLLDTNAFVDHLRRGPKSKVTTSLLAAPPGTVYLCSVVLGELIFGAVRSGILEIVCLNYCLEDVNLSSTQ